MPQMMPINWMISFIFFIMIFITFNIMNYYIMIFNIKKNNNSYFSKSNSQKKNYWKW
uniref:ATP synthase F0 subunit 8 n=1 Tax=Somatina indicataria TaxID=1430671 RepID=UPI001F1365A4|nr:ATP synthase F0 subunit 8 [Somatina indicataria]UKT61750.1 ATP synthase F0 subunit 8 [Somatina indicataria]